MNPCAKAPMLRAKNNARVKVSFFIVVFLFLVCFYSVLHHPLRGLFSFEAVKLDNYFQNVQEKRGFFSFFPKKRQKKDAFQSNNNPKFCRISELSCIFFGASEKNAGPSDKPKTPCHCCFISIIPRASWPQRRLHQDQSERRCRCPAGQAG